jgi:ATP-binding cassette, subfamily B, bacterial
MAEQHFEEEQFDSKFSGKTVLRIIGLTKPHWKLLVGFLVFIAITSVTESTYTFLIKKAIDEGIAAGDLSVFGRYMVMYGGMVFLLALSVFAFIYCAGWLGELITYDLRKKMFAHLQRLSFSFFDRTPIGWLMSRVTSDSTRISELATWMLLDLTWAITNMVAGMVYMLIINWRMALWVIAVIPILVIVAVRFKKYIIHQYRKVRSINSKITGSYNENITGVRVVKALVREEENLRSFGTLTNDMFKSSYRAAWLSSLFLPIVQIISAVAVSVVIWYGGIQTGAGTMTVGGIQAFIGYITFMLWPVQDLARVYSEMQRSIASAERVFSLLDTEPDIADSPDATAVQSLRGTIVFDHVCFHYEEDNPVLKDFTLEVTPGETIALVGPTGGGKTTIANLACRFYEPKQGKILIDGVDYRAYTQESIQSKLGVVLQTPHMFSGTIMDNIRYGRLDATESEVIDAARAAHAHEFIEALNGGYDEEVGEGGALLSVGQKQLISLARAILAKPDIIIMDEATSSIDTITEGLIQRGIDRLLSTSTGFVIAHRLSTIRNADRIMVIERGQVTESGTHDELIAHEGHYFSLYTKQFRREHSKDVKALR